MQCSRFGVLTMLPLDCKQPTAISMLHVVAFEPGFEDDTTYLYEWERSYIQQEEFPITNLDACFRPINPMMERPQLITASDDLPDLETSEPPAKKRRGRPPVQAVAPAKKPYKKRIPAQTGILSVCGDEPEMFFLEKSKIIVNPSTSSAVFPRGTDTPGLPAKGTSLPDPVGPAPTQGTSLPDPVRPAPTQGTSLPDPVGPAPTQGTSLPASLPDPVGPAPTQGTSLPASLPDPVGPAPTQGTLVTSTPVRGPQRYAKYIASTVPPVMDFADLLGFQPTAGGATHVDASGLSDLFADIKQLDEPYPPLRTPRQLASDKDAKIDLLVNLVTEMGKDLRDTKTMMIRMQLDMVTINEELRLARGSHLTPSYHRQDPPSSLAPTVLPLPPSYHHQGPPSSLAPTLLPLLPLTPTTPTTPRPTPWETDTDGPGILESAPFALTEQRLRDLVKASQSDRNLAATLVRELFSDQERLRENVCVSGWKGATPLSPTGKRTDYIYRTVQRFYYEDPKNTKSRQVKLRKAMDEVNRRDRAELKKKREVPM